MHRYEELEKLYYKKRLKKLLTILTILASIFIVVSSIIYILIPNEVTNSTYKKVEEPVKLESNRSKVIEIKENKKELERKVTQVDKNISKTEKITSNIIPIIPNFKITEEYKLNLNPIYPTIDIEKRVVKEVKELNKSKIVDNNDSNISLNIEVVKKEIKVVPKIKKVEQKNIDKVSSLKVKRANLIILIDNYNKRNNYEDAIKIAKILYNNGKFKSSVKWSFKANSIKPTDDESWIIYAQSLQKLNKEVEAKKVLKSYIENYGQNKKIENLLRSLE